MKNTHVEYLVGCNTRVISLESISAESVIPAETLIRAFHEQYPDLELYDDSVYASGYDGTEQECRDKAMSMLDKKISRCKNRAVNLYSHMGAEFSTAFLRTGKGIEVTVWYVDMCIIDEDSDQAVFPRVRIAERTADMAVQEAK